MSIKIMSSIWESGPSDMGERFVLLAIADHANDDGLAYPSASRGRLAWTNAASGAS